MKGGIYKAIIDLARDEGNAAGLRLAEDWNLTLEAMTEVATSEERAAIVVLGRAVREATLDIINGRIPPAEG